MKALVFNPTIPRFVAGKVLGRLSPSLMWRGPAAPLRFMEVEPPRLPADDWVRVKVRLAGICGSDLHAIRLEASVVTSAFTSFPCIPGHEIVGTVMEVGPAVKEVEPGQRVTVEPSLPCETRGLTPCVNCAVGAYNRCLHFADGALSPGLSIGFCRDTGGGWGETFVAHHSQLLPVPESVSDENALLVEPAACLAQPLLTGGAPPDGATVLVVGGGTIGQCAVAVLRALGSRARIVALVKHEFQGRMAERLGADVVLRLRGGEPYDVALARLVESGVHRPLLGRPVLSGGVDLTLECVGSSRSLTDALRLTRPGGRVIVLGLAAVATVDWAHVWLRELTISGSYVYALVNWEGRRRKTMGIVLDWMAERRLDLSALITHRFPLDAYEHALAAADGKAASEALKVAFTHPETVPHRQAIAESGRHLIPAAPSPS